MKISYSFARDIKEFSTIAELRDVLLASYPGAAYLGAPIVLINRDDPVPAWGWLVKLLRTRTDWWPAAGIALQHAARDGGDLARIALADFLASYRESVVLLEWTEPVATMWPDVPAGQSADPDQRLGTIVARQRTLWDVRQDSVIHAATKAAADLEAELASDAKAGRPSGGVGPWSWLVIELLFHPEKQPWIPAACAKLAAGTDAEVRAVLAWFVEEHDLWRHLNLLEGWHQSPPPWWDEPADKRPRGWRFPFRRWNVPGAKTLGDVALGMLYRARGQTATRPIVDLAPIFGGRAGWYSDTTA
jgi:hypothetical protein